MNFSKKITIFEGADGSGKTTAAREFAAATGARYVHCTVWPRVGPGLARFYAEAMLPAVLGYQDVVLDRSWLSEQPYGAVYRDGSDRVGAASRRMLERLALRCGALVVRCDPGEEVCAINWRDRKGLETKDWEREEGVKQVNRLYRSGRLKTDLLVIDYDYTHQREFHASELLDSFRPECHPTDQPSAGNWNAKVCLVGETFAEPKDGDLMYQWPFASFSGGGCSRWLTEQLHVAGIREDQLMWVNSDMICPGGYNNESVEHLVALGAVAANRLDDLGYSYHAISHPQHAMRFHRDQTYELVALLQELLA